MTGNLQRATKITAARIAAAAVALVVVGCKDNEIQFTRIPVVTAAVDNRVQPNNTSLQLLVPLDLSRLISAVDAALPEQIARSKDYHDDIACDRRKGPWLDCMGANVTTELTRAGPVSLAVNGSNLTLNIPVRYAMSAQGLGWANYLVDAKRGTTVVSVPVETSLTPSYRLDARIGRDFGWSEKAVPILRGKASLAAAGDAKIRSHLAVAADAIRQTFNDQPVRQASERAWQILHAPITLSPDQNLWLRALPERVSNGGFTVVGKELMLSLVVDARVAVQPGERPSPLLAIPLPHPTKPSLQRSPALQPQVTVLNITTEFSQEPLRQVLAAAFPKMETFETQATPKSVPLKVRVAATNTFPSRGRVGIEMQIDVVEPFRLAGMTGKAYFLAKPRLSEDGSRLEFSDVTFPPPASTGDKTTSEKHPLTIGEEPFAGRIVDLARLDVGSEINGLLARLNAGLTTLIDDDIAMTGSFGTASIASVEPVRAAFRLNLETSGSLQLIYRPRLKIESQGPTTSSIRPAR